MVKLVRSKYKKAGKTSFYAFFKMVLSFKSMFTGVNCYFFKITGSDLSNR